MQRHILYHTQYSTLLGGHAKVLWVVRDFKEHALFRKTTTQELVGGNISKFLLIN